MKTIVIGNQKGGVGKTTTAQALSSYISEVLKKKVLIIDLDSQRNLTHSFGLKDKAPSSYELLKKTVPIEDMIHKINEHMYMIVATENLKGIPVEISSAMDANVRLRNILKKSDVVQKFFDYVIIDTPPAVSTVTANAFLAADELVIAAGADQFSLDAIKDMISTVEVVNENRPDTKLKIAGVLLTKFKKNMIADKTLDEKITDFAGKANVKVFKTKIRESVAVKESQICNRSLYEYCPKCTAMIDYINFGKEYLGA